MGRYKYRMDVDGYGWSSRFRKLLSSKSLIMKPTVYVRPPSPSVLIPQCRRALDVRKVYN